MYRTIIKRLLDILISLIALPFFLLVFLIIAVAIYIEDKGPFFYNAKRLGKDGKTFTMYKFKTMKANAPDIRNADGTTYNAEDDPRLTKVGRFIRKNSIDETPQLLNVLKGEMSIIGPRPDITCALDAYQGNERKKLEVLPGITGYSQAYYRNDVSLHERFQQDIYYVDNLSFLLDVKIICKTIYTIFLHRGVYRN